MRPGLERGRLAMLSAGAPLDAKRRRDSALHALVQARCSGAEHVLLTGDLTEDGSEAQFEVLADVLEASRIAPEQITLVCGNHDTYSAPGAFERALRGPLWRYRNNSRKDAFSVLEDAVITPICTAIDGRWFARAGGAIGADDLQDIARLSSDRVTRERALVVAMHHPPMGRTWPGLEWFDGLENALPLRELLIERPRVHVLHGHVHRELTHRLFEREHAQIFAAASVRDSDHTLRLYQAHGGVLRELPTTRSAFAQTAPTEKLAGLSLAYS